MTHNTNSVRSGAALVRRLAVGLSLCLLAMACAEASETPPAGAAANNSNNVENNANNVENNANNVENNANNVENNANNVENNANNVENNANNVGPVCGDGVCEDGEDCAEDCEQGKCEADGECEPGELCLEMLCVEADCRQDEECGSVGLRCEGNLCVQGDAPEVVRFELDPAVVVEGEVSTLSWSVERADTVTLQAEPVQDGLGAVEAEDSRAVVGDEDLTFTITASSAAGEVSREVSLEVVPVLSITSPQEGALLEAQQGEPFAVDFLADGGLAPLDWMLVGELPEGVEFDSEQARLTGTPLEAGTFMLAVRVADAMSEPQRVSRVLTLVVSPPTLEILTEVLPDAVMGQPYEAALTSAGGAPPVAWALVAGALPEGLELSSEGVISGTPSVIRSTSLTLEATDSAEPAQVAEATYSLNVVPAPLMLLTDALPQGRVGEEYSVTLEGQGGVAPLLWAIDEGLPDGLALTGGLISGTPTVSGAFPLSVVLRDSDGQEVVWETTLVVDPATLVIDTEALPDGREGEAYSETLSASGGEAPYVWSVDSTPAGLSLSGEGLLSGTPTVAGTTSMTVSVESADGQVATAVLVLVVRAEAFLIVTDALPQGRVAEPYEASLVASGGQAPYRWVVGNLPPGLSFSASGVISGVPEEAAEVILSLTVFDSANQGVSATVPLSILAGPPSIETSSLPDATVGQPYEVLLVGRDGAEPYTWSLAGGLLPLGVQLREDGTLAGVPQELGVFEPRIELRDAAEQVAAVTLSLTVLEDEPPPPESPPLTAIAGSFVDISRSAGEPLDISLEDDGVTDALPIGFDFVFYGQSYSELYVASNGLVAFELPSSTLTNTELPSTASSDNLIAVFWDDLDPGDHGEVFMETRGVAPHRRTIIQWRGVDFFTGDHSRLNFQVILYEGTHQIQLLYDLSTQGTLAPGRIFGNSATVGVENDTGTLGVELSFDTPDAVLPGQVYLLTPEGDSDYTIDTWSALSAEFVDISGSGQVVAGVNSDDSSEVVNIGFSFPFYGTERSEVTVDSNGFLSFAADDFLAFSNHAIPSTDGPEALIAPFWDDLTPGLDGQVFTQVLGESPTRRFVVQWDRFERFLDTGSLMTFQAVLHETSGAITFHYGPIFSRSTLESALGSSATVGIEDDAGLTAVQLSFNEAALRSGMTLAIVPYGAGDFDTYIAAERHAGFIDITAEGQAVAALDDQDDAIAAVDIGFPFPFDGQTFDRVSVGTNGFVQMGDGHTFSAITNAGIPGTGNPDGFLAPFWDDLDLRDGGGRGEVLTQTLGVAPNRRFVIQWLDVALNLDTEASLTFEVVLNEDGSAAFHYGALKAGSSEGLVDAGSATVGFESLDGSSGVQVGFNERGVVRSGSLVILREP